MGVPVALSFLPINMAHPFAQTSTPEARTAQARSGSRRGRTRAPAPAPVPLEPRVHVYKLGEIDYDLMKRRSVEIFGHEPHSWQLDAAAAMLQGKDVVIDVGTGNGKTLCASLALMLDTSDIGLIVSPISALMIDQV
jgi:ATP-dependent helicase YprA (DUF1998 family)